MLKGQVVVRRDCFGARDDLQQAGANLCGLKVGHAYSANARALADRRQQGLEQSQVAEVLAIGGRILAHEHDFLHPLADQPRDLRHHVGGRTRDERPAERRDRAERASTIAAGRQLDRSDGAAVKPAPKDGR